MIFSDVNINRQEYKDIDLKGWKQIKPSKSIMNIYNETVLPTEYPLELLTSDNIIGVLFSGGYDSTALLIYYLERGYTVLPISLKFNGLDERATRVATLFQLKKIYKERLLPSYEFETNFYRDGYHYLGQQALCAFWPRFLHKEILDKLSTIAVGYNKTDLGTMFQKELKQLYLASMKLDFNYVVSIKDFNKKLKIPKFEFPFIKQEHQENCSICYSFENEYDLILPCYECEIPNFKYFKKDELLLVIATPDGQCTYCSKHVEGYDYSLKNYSRVMKFQIKKETKC